MNIYLWKEDIEDGESVMTAEYRPVEYGKDYDVVNNPDKFELYIDGKEVKEQQGELFTPKYVRFLLWYELTGVYCGYFVNFILIQ